MTWTAIAVIVVLAVIETLASYISRVYAEFGKILSREVQENLDVWEERIEPHLGLTREHAAISAAVAQQLALGLMALEFGALLFDRGGKAASPAPARLRRPLLGVVLVIVFCNQALPWLLFKRTRGPLGGAAAVAHPPAAVEHDADHGARPLLLLRGVAGGGAGHPRRRSRGRRGGAARGRRRRRHPRRERPRPGALRRRVRRQAGERSHDPAAGGLCRSRHHDPGAVPGRADASTTSRACPVYCGSLDNVTGIAFAHDLLQITDEEARTRTVASIQRPAAFVPETKTGYELLREMQREKQHMRIVIDEYGGVAGLVTIEDLLEQIVGDIRDEHETDAPVEEPQREAGGAWVVPGGFPVDQLGDLFGEPLDLGEEWEAASLGGLVSEIEGRIPLAGEMVVLRAGRPAHGSGGVHRPARGAGAGVSAGDARGRAEIALQGRGRRGLAVHIGLRGLPRPPLLRRDLPYLAGQAAADEVALLESQQVHAHALGDAPRGAVCHRFWHAHARKAQHVEVEIGGPGAGLAHQSAAAVLGREPEAAVLLLALHQADGADDCVRRGEQAERPVPFVAAFHRRQRRIRGCTGSAPSGG